MAESAGVSPALSAVLRMPCLLPRPSTALDSPAALAAVSLGLFVSVVLTGCGTDETGLEKPRQAAHDTADQTPDQGSASSGRDELVPLRASRIERAAESPRFGGDGNATRLDGSRPPGLIDEPGGSERLADRIVRELRRMLSGTPGELPVSADFRCAPLRPVKLEPVFESQGLRVFRASGTMNRVATIAGPGGLAAAVKALRDGLENPLAEIKAFTIDTGPDGSLIARVHVELGGPFLLKRMARQVNARWTTTWGLAAVAPEDRAAAGTLPLVLRSIRVEAHEETERWHPRELFFDVTRATIGATASFAAQVERGIDEWAGRVTRLGDMHLSGHHGLAVGDVNGDGLEDLYVCDAGSLPNRLYVQQPDGTARESASASGVDLLEDSRGALLVDLDNDGDQDLVVATIATIVFAENDGSGRFSTRGGHMGAPYPFSLSAADYDSDGDLDIHVCVYGGDGGRSGSRGFEACSPAPFEDARNGGRNVLLENTGAFRFADVTDEVGLGDGNTRWSLAAAWEDYDHDGDPDLYVANDFGRNNLLRNDAGPGGRRRFVDVAAEAGVEDTGAGMSVAWGDHDRDGESDILVGNMFSAAGSRISHQRGFAAGRDPNALAGIRRMARGNSLFRGRGQRFDDVSLVAGVTMGRWARSSGFVDIDNDGWEDIVVANGFISGSDGTSDL